MCFSSICVPAYVYLSTANDRTEPTWPGQLRVGLANLLKASSGPFLRVSGFWCFRVWGFWGFRVEAFRGLGF